MALDAAHLDRRAAEPARVDDPSAAPGRLDRPMPEPMRRDGPSTEPARLDGAAREPPACLGPTCLGPAQLGQLRTLVRTLQAAHAAGGGGPSLAEVVRLASALRDQHGITVDFAATPVLGQPLVVVRLPAGPLPAAPADQLGGLTPRERQVAALVAAGLSNKQIAARLQLTLGTVKHYVHQILDKTGLPSRVAIATAAQATPPRPGPPPIVG